MQAACNMANGANGTTGVTTATLSPGADKLAHLAGFAVSARATGATDVTLTVTGVVGGPLTADVDVGAGTAVARTVINFDPPLPATAKGVDITVSLAAVGAGGVTTVWAWGVKE